jgi:hypothetical protein
MPVGSAANGWGTTKAQPTASKPAEATTPKRTLRVLQTGHHDKLPTADVAETSDPTTRPIFHGEIDRPLPNGTRADACGFRDDRRRLPALDHPYNPLSTARRELGIIVHVHPVGPLENC